MELLLGTAARKLKKFHINDTAQEKECGDKLHCKWRVKQ
jgi:hypothetical protein